MCANLHSLPFVGEGKGRAGIVAHTCNPNTLEAEVEELLNFKTNLGYIVSVLNLRPS